jgi:hypothetical protein
MKRYMVCICHPDAPNGPKIGSPPEHAIINVYPASTLSYAVTHVRIVRKANDNLIHHVKIRDVISNKWVDYDV